ncbi:hypothetical protein QBZ16_000364 [Prototheca wickerhamii]|uniref:Uncharacterized protein n=1 Tax=Prototheca wickerhamii TaxID=3111 RepID=A0AAD9IL56_PROWI|nr:hypothetical protein QBZ16_000364 [Prototheca wickerhamii]
MSVLVLELAKHDAELTIVRDICAGLAAALGTTAGVAFHDKWLPYALRALGSQQRMVRELARLQLRRVLTGSQRGYPPELRARVASQLLGLLSREARDYSSPSGIAAEHLLSEPDVLGFLCRDPALRKELARAAGPPNAAEARLRAATVALNAVRLDPRLSDEFLPLLARLLRIARLDVLATMGALECIQAAVLGQYYDGSAAVSTRGKHATPPEVTALILDTLIDPLIDLVKSDEPSLRNSALVTLCTLVGVTSLKDDHATFDWKREAVFSKIAALLGGDDVVAATEAVRALTYSEAGAGWVVSEETVLRRLAALALGKEARAGGERAAAREALASALERRPGGLGGRVRAALEREAAADWAAELTTDRGSGEERLAAKRLLRALIQTGWGAAGICGHPEALRLALADREAALPALDAASAPGRTFGCSLPYLLPP